MHFSREHVGQLLADQAKLWDELSLTSGESLQSLDKVDNAQKAKPLPQGKPTEKTDIAGKLSEKTASIPTDRADSESTVQATKGSEGSNDSTGSAIESGLISSASQQKPPESVIREAGTHRLAWSCDGDRSPSVSDT